MPFQLEIDLAIRLALAAVFGAAVGLEREIHGHPAGMRTHLLVSLGSALFTVLSIHGFGASTSEQPIDPSRVAAQIVSGIGFLGAGAIIKDGFSVRGLTTAASLWAVAAVGMASGSGDHVLALIATAIIIFSLWPLNRIAERVHGVGEQVTRVSLTLDRLDALATVTQQLTQHRLEIVGLQTERVRKGQYNVEIDVRSRPGANVGSAIESIAKIEGVELAGTAERDG